MKVSLAEVYAREGLFEGEDEEEAWHCAVIVGLEGAVVFQIKIVGTALGVQINR